MPKDVSRHGEVVVHTADRRSSVRARARPLPSGVTDLLVASAGALSSLQTELHQQRKSKEADVGAADDDEDGATPGSSAASNSGGSAIDDARALIAKLGELFAAAGPEWAGKEKNIVSFSDYGSL